MKKPDLRLLVYRSAFAKCPALAALPSHAKTPTDFKSWVALLVNEIRSEAKIFYGVNSYPSGSSAQNAQELRANDNIPAHARSDGQVHSLPVTEEEKLEARYPGIDYTTRTHRNRMKKFVNHVRLFYAFDSLGLTNTEILKIATWDGTLTHRRKAERDLGRVIVDTTGGDIPHWKEAELRDNLIWQQRTRLEDARQVQTDRNRNRDTVQSADLAGAGINEQGPGFDLTYSSPTAIDTASKDEEDEGYTTASSPNSAVFPTENQRLASLLPPGSYNSSPGFRTRPILVPTPQSRSPRDSDAAIQLSYMRALEATHEESLAFARDERAQQQIQAHRPRTSSYIARSDASLLSATTPLQAAARPPNPQLLSGDDISRLSTGAATAHRRAGLEFQQALDSTARQPTEVSLPNETLGAVTAYTRGPLQELSDSDRRTEPQRSLEAELGSGMQLEVLQVANRRLQRDREIDMRSRRIHDVDQVYRPEHGIEPEHDGLDNAPHPRSRADESAQSGRHAPPSASQPNLDVHSVEHCERLLGTHVNHHNDLAGNTSPPAPPADVDEEMEEVVGRRVLNLTARRRI